MTEKKAKSTEKSDENAVENAQADDRPVETTVPDTTGADPETGVADTTTLGERLTQPAGYTTVEPVPGSEGPRSQMELDEQQHRQQQQQQQQQQQG